MTATEPTFDAKLARALLRGLGRRRGKKRTQYVCLAVLRFLVDFNEYRLNHSEPPAAFDPQKEWGNVIRYASPDPRVTRANILRAIAHAMVMLPPGEVVNLRRQVPWDYGTSKSVGIYRAPGMVAGRPINLDWKGTFDVASGFIDHGLICLPGP